MLTNVGASGSRRALMGWAPIGIAALAMGCAGRGSGPAARPAGDVTGTVRLAHLNMPTHIPIFQKLAARFQEQNPRIQVTAEPTHTWDNAKIIASAVGGAAQDVVWTAENVLTQLYIKGIIADLDDLIAKDRQFKKADYYEAPYEAFKFRGKQIGVPIYWGAYVAYYNKTLFERAGRKVPDGTWTWSSFLEASRALTTPASGSDQLGEYGFETWRHFNGWSPWVWNAGGDLFNAEGTRCTLDSPAAVEGLRYVMDLIHRWKVAPNTADVKQFGLGTNAFSSGKVGMVFNAAFRLPDYRKADLFEWDIAPLPKGPKDQWRTLSTAGLAMWSGTKSKDATWAFIRYLIGEESSKTYVTERMDYGVPAHKAAAPLFNQDPRTPKSKQVFYDAAARAKPAYITPYGQKAISVLNPALDTMWDEGRPAKTVLEEIVPRVNATMQEEIAADLKK